MKYKIIEIEKSGYFEIQEQVEKRKLTFKGFKTFLAWEKMYINYLWNGKWIINLWNNTEDAKNWLKEFKDWNTRTNKEELIEM